MDIATKAYVGARQRLQVCWTRLRSVVDVDRYIDGPHHEEQMEEATKAFRHALDQLVAAVVIVLERLELTKSLDDFLELYEPYREKAGFVEYFDGDSDMPFSEALQVLEEQLSLLSPLFEVPTEETAKIGVLTNILEQTDLLIHTFGIKPSCEKHVQDALHPVLRLSFPDCVRETSVAQTTKIYKPDFGITSLATAIEAKFIDAKGDVGKVLGGLYEDMQGYAGSPHWLRFHGLIYQTEPFTTQQIVDAEGAAVGVPRNWKLHVVTGPGAK